MVLHLIKLESPSLKDALCQVWLTLVLWFLRRFSNSVNVFLLFHNNLHLEKGRALHLNKLGSPSPKDASVPSLVEIGPVVLEKIFKFRQYIFAICNYLPLEIQLSWKRAGLFI